MGHSPWGRKDSDLTEQLFVHACVLRDVVIKGQTLNGSTCMGCQDESDPQRQKAEWSLADAGVELLFTGNRVSV